MIDPLRDPGADGDPLGAALLPVLMHSLAGATQLLSSLNAVLALPDGGRWLDAKADDLGAVSREIEDLGWLLAVLASSAGADLLQARREARGLELVIDAVRDALRRSGRDLPPGEREPLHLAPDVADGWQFPWSVGALLLASGRARETEGAPLAWGLAWAEHEATARLWARPASPAAELAAVVQRVGARLPGAEFCWTDGGWNLGFPARWLRSATAGERADRTDPRGA